MRIKEMMGFSLSTIGGAVAGIGFGKKDTKLACIGSVLIGIGALFRIDAHAEVISQHTDAINALNIRLTHLENK